MTAFRYALLITATLLLGVAAFASVPKPDDPHATLAAAERERIRAHLLGAERLMRAADVAHLSEEQRANRARVIELLREYREAGVFPHNHDFPTRRVPYFVDAHGTRCAMAYLIAETGGEALVERVAATANNAYVPDLAGDPEFSAWLERYGMTVAEAARVQPAYNGQRLETNHVGKAIAVTSAAASIGTIALQALDAPPRDLWRSLVGIGVGGLGIAAGGAILVDDSNGSETYGGLTVGAGAAAAGIALWNLFDRDEPASGPAVSEEDGGRSTRVRARPLIGLGEPALGLAVNVSF